MQRFECRKLFLGKCLLGICQDHDVKSTSLVLPCTQSHTEFQIETVRGIPRMIIPGFTLRHARTVASCASSSVKSHVSSNKATPRKGRVVPTLLTSRFSCCNLDWGFRFGHISSIFLSMARRTQRGTDFVGWESSTTQLKTPFRNVERLCHLFSRFHFLSRHESKGRTLVLRPLSGFIKSIGDRPPDPRPSPVPAPLEARYLVALQRNHVRVGTLETPPVYKSNIASVYAESLGSF